MNWTRDIATLTSKGVENCSPDMSPDRRLRAWWFHGSHLWSLCTQVSLPTVGKTTHPFPRRCFNLLSHSFIATCSKVSISSSGSDVALLVWQLCELKRPAVCPVPSCNWERWCPNRSHPERRGWGIDGRHRGGLFWHPTEQASWGSPRLGLENVN